MRARGFVRGGVCVAMVAGIYSGTMAPRSVAAAGPPTVTSVASPQLEGATGIGVTGSGFADPVLLTNAVTEVDLVPTFSGATVKLTTLCPSNGQSDCFFFIDDSHLTIGLPTVAIAPGQYDTEVTTPLGTSTPSSSDFLVVQQVAPTVTSVTPNTGPESGGPPAITINGTDFSGSGFTASAVSFGGTPATSFSVTNATAITATPPSGSGLVDITVTTASTDGTSQQTSPTSGADQYTFEPLPTVTSVVPPDGVLAGGGTVTVNGAGFTGASVVSVGTTAVSACPGSPCFNIVSPTQITVDIFPGSAAPATVDLTVTTSFGTSAASPPADSYTYMPIPIVTAVTPNAGATAGGNPVTLTGTGFEFGGFIATTVSVVGVGNVASFTVNSATSITIPAVPAYPPAGGTCPSNATATGVICDITVTTGGGTSSATSSGSVYTYVSSFPNVVTVSPKYGAAGGGAYVTVFGSNFGNPSQGFGATEVDFGTNPVFPCSGSTSGCFTQIGTTTLDVYTTAGTAGTVDIRVVTPGGTSNVAPPADQYTFVAAGAYTAVNPFRICDTRPAGPGIASNQCDTGGKGTLRTGHETVTAQITGAHVPNGAQAAVVNITAINHSGTGTYVIAYPAGGSVPLASNINLAGGKVESNLAIVRLSVSGQISLFNAAGTVDVIVDLEGYFAAAPTGTSAGAFHAIPPLRICDSRGGTLCATATGSTSAPLSGGVWRRVIVSGLPPGAPTSTPDIPSDGTAAAAAFNLTATGGTVSTFLSVAVPSSGDACPTTAPSFSNENPTPGISLPIRVISNLGPKQDICLYSALGKINFLIDNNGWFGKSSAPVGALFYSVPPTRICDTRPSYGTRCQSQPLGANFSELIHVAGIVAVPAWNAQALKPVAVVANLTGISGSSATYLTLYPSDAASVPRASDLNPTASEVIANLAITSLAQTGTLSGNVKLYNALGTVNAILDVSGWFQ